MLYERICVRKRFDQAGTRSMRPTIEVVGNGDAARAPLVLADGEVLQYGQQFALPVGSTSTLLTWPKVLVPTIDGWLT